MFKKDDKVKVIKGIKTFEGLTGTVLAANDNQVKVRLNMSEDTSLQKNLINIFEADQLELESLDLLTEDGPTFDNDVEEEEDKVNEEYIPGNENISITFATPDWWWDTNYWESEDGYQEFILDYLGAENLEELEDIPQDEIEEAAIEFGEKVLEKDAQNLMQKYPGIKITVYYDEFEIEGPVNTILRLIQADEGDSYIGHSLTHLDKYIHQKSETVYEIPTYYEPDHFGDDKVLYESKNKSKNLTLTEQELKAWCSDHDANYYTQDIKDDKVIIRGLNEALAEYDFKTKELKVFDYSGTTTPEQEEVEYDDNYIRDYVYDIDMIDEKTEIPSWEFASVIATAEDVSEEQVITEAHDRGFKVFLIQASNYEKIVVASEKITEDDIMDDFASYLEGNPKVTELI